ASTVGARAIGARAVGASRTFGAGWLPGSRIPGLRLFGGLAGRSFGGPIRGRGRDDVLGVGQRTAGVPRPIVGRCAPCAGVVAISVVFDDRRSGPAAVARHVVAAVDGLVDDVQFRARASVQSDGLPGVATIEMADRDDARGAHRYRRRDREADL